MKIFKNFKEIQININEIAKWKSKNLNNDFYDFWASVDVLNSNLKHYMDDMNSNNVDNAFFSLKVAYTELNNIAKNIKKYQNAIKKELEENGKL